MSVKVCDLEPYPQNWKRWNSEEHLISKCVNVDPPNSGTNSNSVNFVGLMKISLFGRLNGINMKLSKNIF